MNRLDAYGVTLGGLHLIEASAGTGKTHAISTLYLRSVVELGLLPEQILVVTFTRAATGELGERVRARLRQAQSCLSEGAGGDAELVAYLERQPSRARCRNRLERALLAIDQAAVMTIHGFCSRVLEQNAFENRMPFDTELVESIEPLLQEVVNDFMLIHVATRPYLELAALRSAGFDAQRLLALARTVCRGDRLRFEPESAVHDCDLQAAIDEFEQRREVVRAWLRDADNLSSLGRLHKTKKASGLGKQVTKWIDESSHWLEQPFHGLKEPCSAFERFKKQAEKNPAAQTARLLDWLRSLEACSASFERLRQVTLLRGVQLQREFVEFFGHEFERRKRVKAVQSYDDLLRRLRDTLAGSGGPALVRQLRQRYPLALIDEFQDTDPVQFEVFSQIYRDQVSLFLIGDPKQSIYAFRGADVDSYLSAKQDPRVHVHTLGVNWRSDPRVLAGIDSLYRTHSDPFVSAGIDFAPVSARPNAADLYDASGRTISGVRLLVELAEDVAVEPLTKQRARRRALETTADYVASLLSTQPAAWSRAIRASEIAVLTRTNRECVQTARVLALHGIRCVQTSESSVLQSDAAASLRALLRALHAPLDARRLVALLLDDLVGLEPYQVEQLRSDIDGWERWIQRLQSSRRVWERSGALSVVVWLARELDLKPRLLPKAFGERFVTDLLHSAELLQTTARQQHLSLEAQLEWLERESRSEGHVFSEEQQLRIEADSDAVLVTTVHRSKGLQFPFVVCPFFWHGQARRPGSSVSYRRTTGEAGKVEVIHLEPKLLARDAEELRSAELELRREEARLLYVALTRAKHQVAVLWIEAKGSETSPLHHLLRDPSHSGDAETESVRASSASSGEAWSNGLRAAQVAGVIDIVPMRGLVATVAELARQAETSVLAPPPPLERVVVPAISTTSYSALTATSQLHGEVGRDVDALSTLENENENEPRVESSLPVELPLAELPRGAKTGEALHAILELLDFQDFDPATRSAEVAATLERFGLDPELHEASVRQGLNAVLEVQLLPGNERMKLRNVGPESRRSELEFIMQVAALSVERLAVALDERVSGMPSEYRQDLGRLRFEPISGYVRGFIDLVFEFDGRFYVADYKSNALGDTTESYSRSRIEQEMRQHHYPVQAALYAAAVDRWLRLARADYDYDAHFGGVLYLFLRGMVPELGPGTGVFFHRPDSQAMRDFEAMLGGRVL